MGQGDIYATHAPVIADLCRVEGPVLELGMGWGSTPLLHALCRNQKTLVSMETDEAWAKRFAALAMPFHKIAVVSRDWQDAELDPQKWVPYSKWGLVLVDCAPGEMRTPLISRLKGMAKFIVAHDSEKDYGCGADYKYETVMGGFKYLSEYRFLRPYTLVLSDDEPYALDSGEQRWDPEVAK